jgi:hypothetical protein
MKIKFLICFFLSFGAYAQNQRLHLYFLSDIVDNEYGKLALQKEDKLQLMFKTISKELNYELVIKPLLNFNDADALKLVDEIKIKSPNDIVVFYYNGRATYSQSLPNNLPKLEFRDASSPLDISELSKKMQKIKAQSRLVMIVVDSDESFAIQNERKIALEKTREAFTKDSTKLDSTQNINPQTQPIIDTPIFQDDSLYLRKLDKTELRYYNTTLDSLMNILTKLRLENSNTTFSKRVKIQLNRLSEYPKIGFPNATKPLAYKFTQLPDLSLPSTINQNFSCVVDSMYKKRSILHSGDALNIYLDKLINIPLELDEEVQRTLERIENIKKPIFQKLFISQCGELIVANGTNHFINLNDKLDYTGYVETNFNILKEIQDIKKIKDININLLFSKMDNDYVFYSKMNLSACPNTNQNLNFTIPNYSVIPSHDDISKMFSDIVKTTDEVLKKKLINEIKQVFDTKATIVVQDKSMTNNASLTSQAPKLNIDQYLNRLLTITLKNIQVPVNTLKRNDNFSKVLSLVVIENK